MNFNKEPKVEKTRKPLASVEFGGNGHETEYVLTIHADKYSAAERAPWEWEDKFVELFGEEWDVMDRGARIEITPPNLKRTPETDSKLKEVIKSVIGDDYVLSEIS